MSKFDSRNKNNSYIDSSTSTESSSSSSSDKKQYFKELLKNKTLKYSFIGVVILVLLYLIYKIYNTPIRRTNNKCPKDCSKYINGDININGKICKVPVINGVKCPTNCIYEKEDNSVKYSDYNCDID